MNRSARAGAATLAALAMVLTGCSGPSQTGSGTGAAELASDHADDPAPTTSPSSHSPAVAPTPSDPAAPDPGDAPSAASRPQGRYAIDTGWGPSRTDLDRARRLVDRLSLRELAGQVIVARYAGTRAPTRFVNRLHLGGVIVFDDNITSTTQIRRSNHRLQAAARRAGRDWPVFVGVDQEGGLVARVQDAATRFPTFMTAGAAEDPKLTRRAAAASGAELAGLGFTVDFAPDGDVTSGPEDPTIGSRSAGSRPRLVAEQMNAAVDGYQAAGILPVIKHFPGHGSVPADSHLELPVQDKSLRRLLRSDLVPFRAGVADGISAVMVAHIDVRAVDPGTPASLSRPVITGLLRHRLGFHGLVVTDALNMAAITEEYGASRAAVRTLRAGADVLLMPPSPRQARDGILHAVRSGRLDRGRLEQAATRQVAMLLHQRGLDAARARPGSSAGVSYRLSAEGITVVSGPCRGRLVGDAVRVDGAAAAVAGFTAAATRAGLPVVTGPVSPAVRARSTSVALLGYREPARDADVAVALDTPYVLGASDATSRIAAYGSTPGAMRAVVDVLLGEARAPGRLPVHVAGVPRTGCGNG